MSNEEKQIEEIKNVLIHTCKRIRTREDDIMQDHYAKALYNASYRKQSEWISVDEKLPESEERVLVYINSKRYGKHLDTDRYLKDSDSWARWGNHITHWQPLPEAPKMKGDKE